MHTPRPQAFDTGVLAFEALLGALGPGHHHLLISAHTPEGGSVATASVTVESAPDGHVRAEREGALMFCHVLAQASLAFERGAVFARSVTPDGGGKAVVQGWALIDGWPRSMSAAEVFNAYCTDLATGDPLPPEPDTEYLAGATVAPPVA
ncbi:hypothetical protein PH213_33520 [Streptomyces sp. SRF1]|uniref:hypothetical protein n=1 Tax=Streptomyces sp. SRF1 TaxID=1549642 RepID=UPI0025B0332F|nr:hypothetical protein [Streptomyces sp. SRF1]MDN3059370.1 hypothetical protein [Streptomyces sp. SRF1]